MWSPSSDHPVPAATVVTVAPPCRSRAASAAPRPVSSVNTSQRTALSIGATAGRAVRCQDGSSNQFERSGRRPAARPGAGPVRGDSQYRWRWNGYVGSGTRRRLSCW
jgi:hypothetical protein